MAGGKTVTIADLLLTGAENARTGRELADKLGCNIREVTEWVERDRRRGHPICATSNPEHPGYYIAETQEDLQEYCGRLFKRAGELHKTRRELLKVVDTLPPRETQDDQPEPSRQQ